MSELEDLLEAHIRLLGLPKPKREYRFDRKRRWRFDLAWPLQKVAAAMSGA